MAERTEPVDENSTAAYLLASVVHLKQATVRTGQIDVAAEADEIIALLANADNRSTAWSSHRSAARQGTRC
jgi:hypothetical protein